MRDTFCRLAELTLTNIATFAFPLVFAVLCGRVLGVHDFGVVSFYTALAAFLGVIIEFGFDWLGIREVSQAVGDADTHHHVFSNVAAAKLLICGVTSLAAAAALLWLHGPQRAVLMLAMVIHMVGFALDVSWYLRALERTRLLLGMTLVVRLAGIVVLWLAVTRAGDMAAALWSYAFVALANAVLGWGILVHLNLIGRVRPQWQVIGGLMRQASAIVFGNLNGALLTNGGVALLGLTADPATVGAANLALRVKMAGQAALMPIKQLSYVRLSSLARADPSRAVTVGRFSLAALLGCGAAIALAIIFSAEWIVRHVFQGDYPVAVGLIMLLALSVPVNAAAELFGMQCLIAFGRERSYAVLVAVAAALFCALSFFLRSPLAYGWALLLAEATLATMAALRVRAILAGSR